MRRTYAVVLCILTAGLATMTVGSAPAGAHAVVVATTPANGAEVSTAPSEIRIQFDEPIVLSSSTTRGVAVLDSAGNSVEGGPPTLSDGGRTLNIALRPRLPKDSYIASWTVISADSHPVGGSIQFGVGVPAIALAQPPPPQPSARLGFTSGIVDGLLYLALTGAFGLIAAAALLGLPAAHLHRIRRIARGSAAIAVVVSLAQIGVAYLWDASAVPGGPEWAGLRAFVESRYALTVYARIALLAVWLVLVPPARATARGRDVTVVRGALSAITALAVVLTVVVNGHAGVGAWWRPAVTAIHVVAMISWIGGLILLGWLLSRRNPPPELAAHLPRWSVYAATAIAALVVTGIIQSVIQVRHFAALPSTDYGRILLVKLSLVGVAFVVGAVAHRGVRRHQSPTALRRRVAVEATVGCLVVVVSGVLSSTTPAASAYAPTRTMGGIVGDYRISVTVSPARRGPESFRVTATPLRASVPSPRTVALTLSQPGSGIGSLPVEFDYRLPAPIRPGQPTPVTFISPSVTVPVSGQWTATLRVGSQSEASIVHVSNFSYQVI